MEISPVLVLLVLFWATGYHTSQNVLDFFWTTNSQGGEGL